jgi:hypothetical protein
MSPISNAYKVQEPRSEVYRQHKLELLKVLAI